jgi:hypothetical protein
MDQALPNAAIAASCETSDSRLRLYFEDQPVTIAGFEMVGRVVLGKATRMAGTAGIKCRRRSRLAYN